MAPEPHTNAKGKLIYFKCKVRECYKPHPLLSPHPNQTPLILPSRFYLLDISRGPVLSSTLPPLSPPALVVLTWIITLPSPAGDTTSSVTPLQTLHSTHSQKDLSKHKSMSDIPLLKSWSSSHHQLHQQPLVAVSLKLGRPDWFMFHKCCSMQMIHLFIIN